MECVEKWRNFLEGANIDIFTLIEYAIHIAAADYPKEFGAKRDRIAETLYAASYRCCDCDCHVITLAEHDDKIINDEPHPHDDDEIINDEPHPHDDDEIINDESHPHDDDDDDKIINDDTMDEVIDHGLHQTDQGSKSSSYSSSYDEVEVEALTKDKEKEILGEVFRIKDILANPGDESVAQLYECLRRLEVMQLTVENLKVTQIARQVNQLRKHNSKEIQLMVKRLNSGWKDVVDEWVKTSTTGNDPDHADEKTKISEYEYDDHNQYTANKIHQSAHHSNLTRDIHQSTHHSNLTRDSNPHVKQNTNKERGEFQRNAQIQAVRDCQGQGHKMSSSNSFDVDVGIPAPISSKHKGYPDNHVQKHPDLNTNQNQTTKPDSFTLQNNKSKSPDDTLSFKVNLEAAQKRLREGYQQVENAKKQRRVQAIKLQDLPKQGPELFQGRPVPRRISKQRW